MVVLVQLVSVVILRLLHELVVLGGVLRALVRLLRVAAVARDHGPDKIADLAARLVDHGLLLVKLLIRILIEATVAEWLTIRIRTHRACGT